MGARALMLVAWPTWSAQLAGRYSLISRPVLHLPVTAFGCLTLLIAYRSICRGRLHMDSMAYKVCGQSDGWAPAGCPLLSQDGDLDMRCL